MLLAEVKINHRKIDKDLLEEKSKKLTQKYTKYKIEYQGFSIQDIKGDKI